MRTRLVVGNWKMNLTRVEASALVKGVTASMKARPDVDVVVCPPYLALCKVRDELLGSSIVLGAQDTFWVDSGAFTGQVSPRMLAEAGVRYCIVGHSEKRGRFGKLEIEREATGYFSETDLTVNRKVRALLFHGLTPIICVGETLDEREAGRSQSVVSAQLHGALEGLDPVELYQVVIAYEPVWAIGTGQTCEADEADRMCAHIRAEVAGAASAEAAEALRVLYGGSVKSNNAQELFSMPDIDGGLVGGASLEADGFARIVMSA